MKKIFKFIPVALAAFAMASCNSDDLFDNESVALEDIGANQAYATLDFNNEGITRTGIEVGTGAQEGKYRLLWSKGDQFNLYYMNSLKFNTYKLQSGAGTASGTFAVDENKNFLVDVLPTAASSDLFAIMDDSGKGLTHSFFTNAAGKASVSLDIPKRFTQTPGAALADAETVNAVCMPAFAKGVEVNANGGVKASFKAMAGLLAIDAGDLPANCKAIIVVAKGISGTFEACLEDDAPSVARDARYTYGDYIQVDFDANMATGGSRKIYVPIAAGEYKNLYVFAVTTLADGGKDVINTLTWTGDDLTAKTLNVGAVLGNADNAIIWKGDFTVALGMNKVSQAVTAEYAGTTLAGLSNLIYSKMDGEHDVTINVTTALDDITDFDTKKLYIPTNAEKSASSVSVVFTASDADISAKTLNIVEAEAKTFTAGVPDTWQEVAADATSAAQVREVKISLPTTATDAQVPIISVLAPTSKVTLGNLNANAYAQNITAVTATTGLVLDGVATSSFANVTTTNKNTGSITVAKNATVTALTLTDGDGAVNVNGTVTTLTIGNIKHAADVTIGKGGVITNAFEYGANGATDNNRNSGNIIYAGGTTSADVTNWGSGNITINDLVAADDIINEAKGGTITVNTTALAADAVIAGIQQKAEGKNVSITNATAGKTLTVTSLDIDAACSVALNNVTVGTLDATGAGAGKSVPTTLTDATISTIANYAGIGATEIVAYGSAIYAMDDNTNVTVKAYWNGKANNVMNDGAASKIFTTGQLAALKPNAAGYTIDSRVQFMDLNGESNDQIWKGATVAGALTLDCNNVALQDMNLTNAKFKDTDAGVGLIGKITGAANVTISKVNLQGVYLNTAKKVSDAGILIGSFASTGVLSLDDIIISDVEAFSTKGHNVGGLVGSLLGGANVIGKVSLNVEEIGGAYNVGGLVGYYNGATSLSIGTKAASVTVSAFTNTGTYADPNEEQSALYGTFSNAIGGIENGAVTLSTGNGKLTASYDFTTENATKWTALQFYGNYKWNTGNTVKRAYYPGNNFVGFMKTGSATINGVVQVNNWKNWYEY